jgi:hypothetical protein
MKKEKIADRKSLEEDITKMCQNPTLSAYINNTIPDSILRSHQDIHVILFFNLCRT